MSKDNDKEMMDFLGQIDKEVAQIEDERKKTEAQIRLEEAMRVYTGDDELISSLDILEKIKNEPEEEKFLTGFKQLDEILGGFRKQQLIVLAAPTKSGKTSFSVELTIRMKQTSPVWLPFEESAEELIRKFYEKDQEPPIFYTPKQMKGNTTQWIEKRVVEGKVKYGSTLFFIDHLHFIVPLTSERLDTRIGQTMRELKTIAKNHDVTIVLIAHLKKTNLTVSPTLEDLRDSSFVAQEADTVIILWRKTKRNDEGETEITNETLLSVQANRRTGTTGNMKLIFNNNRFLEEDWKYDESEAYDSGWNE